MGHVIGTGLIAIRGLAATGHLDEAAQLAEGPLKAAESFGYRIPELHSGHAATRRRHARAASRAPWRSRRRAGPKAWSAASAAHAEFCGTVFDPGIVRDRVRQAADEAADSYLRVTLVESEPGTVWVMTALGTPWSHPLCRLDGRMRNGLVPSR
jgi:glycogen debranching enzyme